MKNISIADFMPLQPISLLRGVASSYIIKPIADFIKSTLPVEFQHPLIVSSVFAGLVILCFALLYRYLFRHTKRVVHGSWTPKSASFDKLRRATYPPPFPNGWFKICDVSDLANDKIHCVSALGLNLIVYISKQQQQRGGDKKVVVSDAFCPHMGAHLGVGGVITDKGIQCPFHQWTFDENGRVADIPYCTGALPKEDNVLQMYPCHVYLAMVWFWFHCDNFSEEGIAHRNFIQRQRQQQRVGKEQQQEQQQKSKNKQENEANAHASNEDDVFAEYADHLVPPQWRLRKPGNYPEVENWTRVVTKVEKFNMHVCEKIANSPDYVHFNTLHNKIRFHPWIDWLTDSFINLHYETRMFSREGDEKHHLYFNNHATTSVFGVKLASLSQMTEVNFEGPGLIHFHVVTPLGAVHLFKTLLPLDHWLQHSEDVWFAEPRTPRFLAHLIAHVASGALEQDRPVWENKIWMKKPRLVSGDGPYTQFFLYWNQFYTPYSDQYADERKADRHDW